MITKEKILDWFVWAMIAVVAILFLLKIFGDSPTLEQQVFGVFTTFLVLFYRDLQNAKSRINKDLQEITKTRCSWLIHTLKCVVFTPLALSRVFECQRALKCGVLNPRANIKEKLGEHSAKLEHLTEIRQELKNHKH